MSGERDRERTPDLMSPGPQMLHRHPGWHPESWTTADRIRWGLAYVSRTYGHNGWVDETRLRARPQALRRRASDLLAALRVWFWWAWERRSRLLGRQR